MVIITKRTFVALIVIVLVLMSQMNSCESASKKKCRFKAKRTKCVDIIPKKQMKKYKYCPNFDVSTLGRCAKTGGICTERNKRCVCDEAITRYFRDQPWRPFRTF